jgi:pumilio RNA-binding family
MRFPSGMRNLAGGIMGHWPLDAGCNMEEALSHPCWKSLRAIN